MPSPKHVVAVQGLGSRYPAAKLVSSTRAESVMPTFKDIYNNYGRPETQISDNGPPFNSKKMAEFAVQNNIELQKIAPLHPSSNPVETFMKPLGKAMKIAHMNKENEKYTLEVLLNNYRDLPHPATGLTPGSMLFRDDKPSIYPRKSVRTKGIIKAKGKDQKMKLQRTDEINESKYKKQDEIDIGDRMLIRNYPKQHKFDPLFLPQPYIVVSTNKNYVTVHNESDGGVLNRHRDDIKVLTCISQTAYNINKNDETENDTKQSNKYCIEDYEDFARQMQEEYYDFDNNLLFQDSRTSTNEVPSYGEPRIDNITHSMGNLNLDIQIVQRSQRTRKPNTQYHNQDILTDYEK